MTTAVLTKAVRDRGVGIVVASVSVGLLLILGLAVYSGLDLGIYRDLPEAMRAVMGIPEGGDAASLAYNVMLGTMGSLTLAGLAVSIGASAIAGEERDGTLGLLLANPTSRAGVLVAKGAGLLVLISLAGLALWGIGELAPVLVDVDVGSTHVGAMALHLVVNALFYGFLALAIGSWTGQRMLASAIPAILIVVSFLLVGLLPLLEATADLVVAVPWHYFDGSQPLVNGVDAADLAVLAAGIGVCIALSAVGLRRRDLRARQLGSGIVDRLRNHRLTSGIAARLTGTARVSGIAVYTASQHQGLLLVVALLMFGFMGLLLGPMYALIEADVSTLAESLPEDVLAFAGGGDMSTPEGFYQTESMGLMAPIAVILVGTTIAARGLAGEERRGTMGLLLANPVARSRVLAEKTAVMVAFVVVVGVATFAGMAGGSWLGGLGMDVGNIAAATTLLILLGLVFSGLALALAALTGRPGVAVYGTVGVAITAHVLQAFLTMNPDLSAWARISPFYYYASTDPLVNGMAWGHAGVLLAIAIGLVAVAFRGFARRDLRQH